MAGSLLGLASGGIAAVYNYSEQVFTLTDASADGETLDVQFGAGIHEGDSVILVCDEGPANATTVHTVMQGEKAEVVVLNNACSTGGASAGNLLVDRESGGSPRQPITSQHAVVLVQGVRGAVFNEPVLYGADSAIISLGTVTNSAVPNSDVSIKDARLLDVAPGQPGISYLLR